MADVVVAGEDDHRRHELDLRDDGLQELEPVHHGHADVADDQVVLALADELDRLLAVGREVHLVGERLELGCEGASDGLVVVGDQDQRHRLPRTPTEQGIVRTDSRSPHRPGGAAISRGILPPPAGRRQRGLRDGLSGKGAARGRA